MKITSANDDAWSAAEGQFQGMPSLLRFRPNLKDHLGNPAYPRKLVIIWNYDSNDQSGMPTDEQSDDMRAFEDATVNALDPDLTAILAFVFTTNGRREWHFYAKDISEVGSRINEALSNFPRLPINLQVEDDPEWDELRQVLEICK